MSATLFSHLMETLRAWAGLIQEYGPIVGVLLLFIYWQGKQISNLLERNSKIYDSEIERMAKVQDQLLGRVLGHSAASSSSYPTISELKEHDQEKTKPDGLESKE